ncbi:Hypp6224 [Branchiostoma lanceolatum]|uniref:Hypp6224 protein n=1 Tax=Branchiostoma lanceolatum TaxID=7740 RepID=A0A8J9YNS7_BRALA|nr:Hypp6224 [Branchiostoma lanceolatum]
MFEGQAQQIEISVPVSERDTLWQDTRTISGEKGQLEKKREKNTPKVARRGANINAEADHELYAEYKKGMQKSKRRKKKTKGILGGPPKGEAQREHQNMGAKVLRSCSSCQVIQDEHQARLNESYNGLQCDVILAIYIKLKHVFWIRWLSMGEAIDGVLRNHRALAVYTEEKAADGDPTSSGYTSS